MNKTEQRLLDSLEQNANRGLALVKKMIMDQASEVAALKVKLKNQDSAELEESEKPEYQLDMKGNLIRILYDRFQIKRPKKQHGKVNKHRLAEFLHTTPQTLYNLQGSDGGRGLRRIYHAALLMAQKLSAKDMRDVVRDLNTYDYDQ